VYSIHCVHSRVSLNTLVLLTTAAAAAACRRRLLGQVFDPQGAVDCAAAAIASGKEGKAVTSRLLQEAVRERRCKDNCTILLVHLQHPGAGTGAEAQAAGVGSSK
jgi:hypothetical protein